MNNNYLKFRKLLTIIFIYTGLSLNVISFLAEPIKSEQLAKNQITNSETKDTKQQTKQKNKIGQFVLLEYEEPKLPELVPVYKAIKQQKFVEQYVDFLNQQRFNLSEDFPIVWANCLNKDGNSSQVNASFNVVIDENGKPIHFIKLCYGLYKFLFNAFSQEMSDAEAYQLAAQAYSFVFFHEVGHGLVYLFDIPVTGKEEDAVDYFSAFIFNSLDDIDTILLGAKSFQLLAESKKQTIRDIAEREGLPIEKVEESFRELAYWGEHSMGEQRYANLVCFVMGKKVIQNLIQINPPSADIPKVRGELINKLAKEMEVPLSRAKRCPKEYVQKQETWQKLIVPYLIPADGGWSNNSPSNSTDPPTSSPTAPGCRWGNC